jgi:hypothetical protein
MKVSYAIGLAYVAIIAYQIYVTVAAIRFAGFQSGKKILLVVLIWVLPLLGAVITHLVIHFASKRGQPTSPGQL